MWSLLIRQRLQSFTPCGIRLNFTIFVASNPTRMNLLITNIKSLLQVDEGTQVPVRGSDMAKLPAIDDAFLLIRGSEIEDFGRMAELDQQRRSSAAREIDASGKFVLPAFCDSHTHLVYGASREIEYVDKIRGLSYEEIARRGGGILNSARRLREMPESELLDAALARLNLISSFGTGAVEIKSGYGLDLNSELKMLRVIRRLKEQSPLSIKATFLGAHAIPEEYRDNPDGYVNLLTEEMLPAVADQGLAEYVDVFCDRGFFTVEQTDRILERAVGLGMIPKIHANELARSGGVQVGVKHGALSVDHLEHMEQEEIDLLLASQTMPTLLPTAALFLGLTPPPARRMLDAGLPIALASDYNPGSSPTGNMQLVIALASVMLRMTPEEAINAATLNGAYAMGLADKLGSISRKKRANILITNKIPSYQYLPYTLGENNIETVIIGGQIQ
jgi:imidazolonepropionase